MMEGPWGARDSATPLRRNKYSDRVLYSIMSNVPAARTLNETLKINYDILNMKKNVLIHSSKQSVKLIDFPLTVGKTANRQN